MEPPSVEQDGQYIANPSRTNCEIETHLCIEESKIFGDEYTVLVNKNLFKDVEEGNEDSDVHVNLPNMNNSRDVPISLNITEKSLENVLNAKGVRRVSLSDYNQR